MRCLVLLQLQSQPCLDAQETSMNLRIERGFPRNQLISHMVSSAAILDGSELDASLEL